MKTPTYRDLLIAISNHMPVDKLDSPIIVKDCFMDQEYHVEQIGISKNDINIPALKFNIENDDVIVVDEDKVKEDIKEAINNGKF